MNKFKTMRAMQLVAGAALLTLAGLAQAQFVWIDAKGVKQFSDQPPPASIPAKNILKAPGTRTVIANAPELSAPKPAEGAAGPKSFADREADYRKRQKEKAEAEEKASTSAGEAAQKSAACDAARARNAQLASGKRIRSADNSVLDEAGRASQQEMVNQALAECK